MGPMSTDASRPTPQDAGAFQDAADALYRSLIEQVPAVVYVDSNELEPSSLYVSPQCFAMFGRRPEEFLADPSMWTRSIHPADVGRVNQEWQTAVRRQDRFECDYRWIKPDGTELWVRDGSVLVRDERGEPLFWQGVMHDITASKRAEESLRESEGHYRLLVENIPAVVYMVAPDDDRRTLYVSPQIERELGYSRREWLEQPDIWMELLHPDDREPTLDAHDHHNETGEQWSREYRLIAFDGRAVWFRDRATLVRDEAGRPQHWLGVQLDITELKYVEEELRAARDELGQRVHERTAELEEANALMALENGERKRAEEGLRTTEHRYRMLVEHIPAVTYIWEVESGAGPEPRSYTSPRIEQMLGYRVDEWHEAPDFWTSRVHPDDRTAVLAATIRSETTGQPFSMEYRYLHKDGHIVWVLDEAALLTRAEDGRPELFQGVMVDVTARREAEAKADETELRYRTLAEQVPAIIYVWDLRPDEPGDALTYVSSQLTSVLGYTREDWRTIDRWLATVHPDDRERVREATSGIVEKREPFLLEYRVLHRDGSVRWVRDQGSVLARDELGRPSRLQGLMIDVTLERQAEVDRAEAEARYRSLVEQIPAVTYIELPGTDPAKTIFAYLSPQAESIFGRPTEELIADPAHFGRMLHPDDRERILELNAHSDATGKPFDAEFRIVRDDGDVVWLHSRATLVRDDAGEPLFWHGVALDITAERRAEASLRELEDRYQRLAGEVFRAGRASGMG
jgi:PAS domain S-box-containing protein